MNDADFREELRDLSERFEAAVERSHGAGAELDRLGSTGDPTLRETLRARLDVDRVAEWMRAAAIPLHGHPMPIRGQASYVRGVMVAAILREIDGYEARARLASPAAKGTLG